MKWLLVLTFVLSVVWFVDAKRGGTFSRGQSKSRPSSSNKYKPHSPPPPIPSAPKYPDSNKFLDSERQRPGFGNPSNSNPIGFDNVNRGSNSRPIGFEGFNNPNHQKIGFDGVNKPSAPGSNFGQYPNQNPGQRFGQTYPGQQNPGMGQSYPGQQNPGFGQSNPGQQNLGFGQSYPNSGNMYPNQHGYPQQNYGHNPQYPNNFGQNYPHNPNFGQSYPGNSFGNSYGQSHFGSGYPGYGSGYQQGFGGFGSPYGGGGYGSPGGFGGGFFGSNNGFNNYGYKKNRFGLGGLPIPIPIPIPFGGFGGFGFGGGGYNSYHSRQSLNRFVQQASNDTSNSTSVYIINNGTFMPCTREHFSYESYNVSITTCTLLNCTAVSLKTVKTIGNEEPNYGSVTMCLDPTATLTTNSSGNNLPRLSDVKVYMKSICELPYNSQNNASTSVVNENTSTVKIEQVETTTTAAVPNIIPNTDISKSNVTSSLNITEKPCNILNCSAIEFCMPKTKVYCEDPNSNACNYSVIAYTSCIDLIMCNSQNSLVIDREVKLNTKKDIETKDNSMLNQNYNENVTVVAYLPPPAALISPNGTFVSQNGRTSMDFTGHSPSATVPSTSPL
uniref:Uncharacterized protein n=1 Tax=Clastoptera arizonana TaxID=38151 RepID=A0A1B6DYP5_9HEMI